MKYQYILIILVLIMTVFVCVLQTMKFSLERRQVIAEYCTKKRIPLPTDSRRDVSGLESYNFEGLDSKCLEFFK